MRAKQAASQLRSALSRWHPLDDAQWTRLAAAFRPKTAPARTHVAVPGEHLREMAFVTSGLLRYYYIDREGVESNKAFISEDMFAGPLASAALNLPIYYGIEALEETHMLVARIDELKALYAEDIVYERLGRHFAELLLMRKELRTRSLLMQTATERYLDFARDFPDLLARVPQYHIASYLGVTEVTLSRLKRTIEPQLA